MQTWKWHEQSRGKGGKFIISCRGIKHIDESEQSVFLYFFPPSCQLVLQYSVILAKVVHIHDVFPPSFDVPSSTTIDSIIMIDWTKNDCVLELIKRIPFFYANDEFYFNECEVEDTLTWHFFGMYYIHMNVSVHFYKADTNVCMQYILDELSIACKHVHAIFKSWKAKISENITKETWNLYLQHDTARGKLCSHGLYFSFLHLLPLHWSRIY